MLKLLFALSIFALALPAGAFSSRLTMDFQGTGGASTRGLERPATQRAFLLLENKTKWNEQVDTTVSGHAWFEGAYQDARLSPPELREQDSSEVRLQDAYIQIKGDTWNVRLGNQQVVWGETFGNSYADIVNPRDLRYGIPLNYGQSRLSTPMLNVKAFSKESSIQLLVIPVPKFNILPLPGSEYLPSLERRTGYDKVVIHRELEFSGGAGNSEFGARLSRIVGDFDLSVFYLNHFNRTPYYRANPLTQPTSLLVINERHDRVQSMGTAIAGDVGGGILRAEAVVTQDMHVATFVGGQVEDIVTNETAYAIGYDFPTWERLNAGIQWGENILAKRVEYLLRRRTSSFLSTRLLVSLPWSMNLELVATAATQDGSFRVQPEVMYPFSSSTELRVGVETFNGTIDSEFGRIAGASRAYAQIRVRL